MRPPFAPLGGPDVLVDKMLGNAYDTVKLVALNLAYIKHVQAQLEDVYTVSQNIANVNAVADALPALTLASNLSKALGALGTDTSIPLGSIAPAKITGITLTVVGTDGNLYFPDAKLTFKVVGTNIVVTLAADAPAVLGTGTAKAHVTYIA